MKVLKAAFGVMGYLIFLGVAWWCVANWLPVNVVFYASLWTAVATVACYGILMWLTPLMRGFSALEKLQQLAICGLLGYIMAISLPTVIDRSLSFYILEKLQQRGGGIQLSKFDEIFTGEYMREHRLVDIRLTEQSESGTIVIRGDCVRLTDKGKDLAAFSRYFRQYFLPKRRLLRGEYTDQLVDPFKRSDVAPDYLCQ